MFVKFCGAAVKFIQRFEYGIKIFINRKTAVNIGVLIEIADIQMSGRFKRPLIGDNRPDNHFEKGGFSAAVRPDETDVVGNTVRASVIDG